MATADKRLAHMSLNVLLLSGWFQEDLEIRYQQHPGEATCPSLWPRFHQ